VTFSKLIEKLTSQDDSVTIDTFLLSNHSYCTSDELLNALMERYRKAQWHDEHIVRLKIFNVIRHWTVSLWYDFSLEEQIKDKTLSFFVRYK